MGKYFNNFEDITRLDIDEDFYEYLPLKLDGGVQEKYKNSIEAEYKDTKNIINIFKTDDFNRLAEENNKTIFYNQQMTDYTIKQEYKVEAKKLIKCCDKEKLELIRKEIDTAIEEWNTGMIILGLQLIQIGDREDCINHICTSLFFILDDFIIKHDLLYIYIPEILNALDVDEYILDSIKADELLIDCVYNFDITGALKALTLGIAKGILRKYSLLD